jgi:hypothetical protein
LGRRTVGGRRLSDPGSVGAVRRRRCRLRRSAERIGSGKAGFAATLHRSSSPEILIKNVKKLFCYWSIVASKVKIPNSSS